MDTESEVVALAELANEVLGEVLKIAYNSASPAVKDADFLKNPDLASFHEAYCYRLGLTIYELCRESLWLASEGAIYTPAVVARTIAEGVMTLGAAAEDPVFAAQWADWQIKDQIDAWKLTTPEEDITGFQAVRDRLRHHFPFAEEWKRKPGMKEIASRSRLGAFHGVYKAHCAHTHVDFLGMISSESLGDRGSIYYVLTGASAFTVLPICQVLNVTDSQDFFARTTKILNKMQSLFQAGAFEALDDQHTEEKESHIRSRGSETTRPS